MHELTAHGIFIVFFVQMTRFELGERQQQKSRTERNKCKNMLVFERWQYAGEDSQNGDNNDRNQIMFSALNQHMLPAVTVYD